MGSDLIRRHAWLVETLDKYGALTRREISDLWQKSPSGDGNPIPERTFHHHRRAIEETFHISIKCNSRGEYYIEEEESEREAAFRRYVFNSYMINNTLNDNPGVAKYIMVDEIPSSREFLPVVIDAIQQHKKISFDYAGFTRVIPDRNIRYSPLFVKLYKQRWYMIGIKEKNGKIRTYALDRVKKMHLLNEDAEKSDYSPEDIFEYCLGVTQSQASPRNIRLRVTAKQAKYLRALPLHHTQQEVFVCDDYSVFTYRLKINYELVHDILGFGESVLVESPTELRVAVVTEMQNTINGYSINNLLP